MLKYWLGFLVTALMGPYRRQQPAPLSDIIGVGTIDSMSFLCSGCAWRHVDVIAAKFECLSLTHSTAQDRTDGQTKNNEHPRTHRLADQSLQCPGIPRYE